MNYQTTLQGHTLFIRGEQCGGTWRRLRIKRFLQTALLAAVVLIYVEANGQGVILKSPAGACFELTVTDAGALTTAVVTCP